MSALHAGSGGPTSLAAHSAAAAEHAGPLLRLAARAAHQMSEAEEGLYAELTTVGVDDRGPTCNVTSPRS